MSNLSDLLPAGAGAKSAEFTASGTLSSGQTVALQSDGTVIAISETNITRSIGTTTTVDTERSLYLNAVSIGSGKIVVQAKGITDTESTVVVGTISGTSITFGTELSYRTDSNTNRISGLAYDSTNNILTLAHPTGTSLVGYSFSISGTTLTSLGSSSLRTGWSFQTDVVEGFFSPQTGSSYFIYSGSSGLYWSQATYSGGSVSWSSGTITTTNPYKFNGGISYDPVLEQVLINCSLSSNSSGFVIIGYFSGSTLTYNAGYSYISGGLNSGSTHETSACHIPNTNSHIFTWRGSASLSDYAYAQIIEWNGSTIDVSNTRYTLSSNAITQSSVSWNTAASKAYALITYSSGANHGIEMSVSVPVITVDANDTINSSVATQYGLYSVYDSGEKVTVVGYLANSSNLYRTSDVVRLAYSTTNSADFVGITDEAIANTATGSVVVEGGVITNSTLVPFSVSSVGTPVVFNAGNTSSGCAAYDSSNNKVVIAYKDSDNSGYGTAIVGTVSGTSISFGSEVVFSAATTDWIGIAFDSSNNKVVITYKDTTASNAVAIVGTVSGTSISFGSPTTYDSGNGNYNRVAYDSNAQKLVVAYQAISNSNYATAIVGTVSGTSISFGSSVVYESATTYHTDVAYDSDSQKVICTCKDAGNSNKGTAIVGTVSGTSISFGSPAVFSTGGADTGRVAYDATAQKVVVVYRDEANSYSGAANVGTVSGTSISFGATVNFTNSVGADYPDVEYDPSGGGVVVTHTDTANGNIGKALFGTVSGTSISFTDAITYESSATYFTGSVYDANAQKMVAISKDGGNSNYGTAAVLTTSASLTTGSTYYVQNDGSLSTTSSSVTAGKALSSTTLLLKG